MNTCLTVLMVSVICVTVLVALFLILLAMPKSRLRGLLLELLGWFTTAGSAALVVSPIDFIPDIALGLGQVDDIAYIIVGILSALFAYRQRQYRHTLDIEQDERPRELGDGK